MKAPVLLAASALALALAGCGGGEGDLNQAAASTNAALPQIAAPNNGDWTQTVTETPEGGVRMGNPDAPVKLVEYASITCPHCAEFAEAGSEPLRERYVRSGQVSWEYRPFVLNGIDVAVFSLLKCNGPQTFFGFSDQLYATQREWLGRLQTMPAAQQQALESMTPTQRSAALVQATGVDQFFRQRGMPGSRVESCVNNQAALEQLAASTNRAAQEERVTGTPTFFINGQEAEGVGYWNNGNAAQSLEPRLRAAIGS